MMAYTRTTPASQARAPWLCLGLDLGQANDYSALAIAERDREPPYRGQYSVNGIPTLPPAPEPATYALSWLQRFPLKTPYPAIVGEVATLVRQLAARKPIPHLRLVVDATGVGRPVTDLLRCEHLPASLVEVTITGGDEVTQDGSAYRVPKRDLVSTVQVLLQGERLKIAQALPEAATLTRELLNFHVKINEATAHDSYGAWREGTNDDLVLATALAVWHGEQDWQRLPVPPTFGYRRPW